MCALYIVKEIATPSLIYNIIIITNRFKAILRRRLLRIIEARVVDRGFWLQAGYAAKAIGYGEVDEGGMLGRSRIMRPREPSKC
jgi:hypothetical protein